MYFNSMTILLHNRYYAPGNLNTSNYANTSKGMDEMTTAAETWYPTPNKTDPVANFSALCLTTQIFQADYYASQIQFYRRGSGLPERTQGCLYWQVEDQWAAPTWAGIERSGRWKILHYRIRDVYRNVIVSPFWNETTHILEVWVTSDLWEATNATVNTNWFAWNGSALGGFDDAAAPKGLRGGEVRVGTLNSTRVYRADLSKELKGLDPKDVVMRMNVSATGHIPNSNTTTTFTHTIWFPRCEVVGGEDG
jgi:beta-mannosidase